MHHEISRLLLLLFDLLSQLASNFHNHGHECHGGGMLARNQTSKTEAHLVLDDYLLSPRLFIGTVVSYVT